MYTNSLLNHQLKEIDFLKFSSSNHWCNISRFAGSYRITESSGQKLGAQRNFVEICSREVKNGWIFVD